MEKIFFALMFLLPVAFVGRITYKKIQKYQDENCQIVVEDYQTSMNQYSNSIPGILHCVKCSRCFPAPGPAGLFTQTQRTYCYSTFKAAENISHL